jgi:hypothetical protein
VFYMVDVLQTNRLVLFLAGRPKIDCDVIVFK